MKVIDISTAIYEGMPVYKNKAEKQPKLNTETNGYVTESRLQLDVHTGTHIDSPLHMIPEGDTFETIDINTLVGPCKVFDLTNVEDRITANDLKNLKIDKHDFILFKTKNSFDEEFNFDFIYLSEDGAAYLTKIGVRGVGIDSLGVERSQQGHPTHKILFENKVIIIEGLRMKDVASGEYTLIAAPLKLLGTDASPARVLLLET
ncbi:cyclase family protein [Evansella sp. AB-P1]|uniref:cyclase family protein n=1 Tax=Evansella sp. AB-P1 TaxID=3037653 RepID=UPI00241CE234|nr:cyclase family protein [Evansella sp. AB-P1]MDG5789700.1 cyclase family protein [Evansella sp. AB-P1]